MTKENEHVISVPGSDVNFFRRRLISGFYPVRENGAKEKRGAPLDLIGVVKILKRRDQAIWYRFCRPQGGTE